MSPVRISRSPVPSTLGHFSPNPSITEESLGLLAIGLRERGGISTTLALGISTDTEEYDSCTALIQLHYIDSQYDLYATRTRDGQVAGRNLQSWALEQSPLDPQFRLRIHGGYWTERLLLTTRVFPPPVGSPRELQDA